MSASLSKLRSRFAITGVAVVSFAAGMILPVGLVPAATSSPTGAAVVPYATTVFGGIDGISCVGNFRCVATGQLRQGANQASKQVALYWNGTQWVVMVIASPAWSSPYGARAALWSVSCSSSTNCIAVGDVPGSSKPALINKFNGTKWKLIKGSWSASKASNLATISCKGATFCLAWGNSSTTACQCEPPNLVERWNGSGWKTVAAPSAGVTTGIVAGDVACVSNKYCIAVGSNYINTKGGSSRWDGSKWHAMTLAPTGAKSLLWSDSCASSTSCMAVGSKGATNPTAPLAEFWNGIRWTAQTLASSPATLLNAVSCPDPTNCIAVSGDGTLNQPVIESWNGTSWALLTPAPNPSGSTATHLSSISCVTATSCMAAGSADTGVGPLPLTERWNGVTWRVVSMP